MSKENSDSSTSESEISACSSNFDPYKTLYSSKTKVPIENAPMYDNLQQFENAMKQKDVIPVGHSDLVRKREEEKERKRQEEARQLEEKNRQRFAKYQGMVPTTRRERRAKNLLTRLEHISGPLEMLKRCVDNRLRVKIITRNEKGIRGVLHASVVAFDKQWNMALCDVLEIWKRKGPRKRKIPPGLGTPVEKGSAAKISHVPVVTETPLGKGVWECTRHLPQVFVRGEHVVLVNIV